MSKQYDVAVLVCNYNPNWSKLRATLCSILEQKSVRLQIIISDDGSEKPLFEEIEAFFANNCFQDYKIVSCSKNRGTVYNVYKGLCAIDTEYVKPISPGDLFYDREALSKWLVFSKQKNADISFCDAIYYNRKNDRLNIIRHTHSPQNMSIYLLPSTYEDMVINYYCLNDIIVGAFTLVKRDLMHAYIKLLLNRVIYVEDDFIRMAVLDKKNIIYYPCVALWYEFADGGISTSGEKKWEERITRDHIQLAKIVIEQRENDNSQVNMWLIEYLKYLTDKNNFINNKIIKYLKHPRWLYWRIYRIFFRVYTPVIADEKFLIYCFKD